jgi:hypothetical protein
MAVKTAEDLVNAEVRIATVDSLAVLYQPKEQHNLVHT